MHRLGPRLLLSQIGISFLVSFILGLSTLTLARAYFLASIEDAMDVQALLISEALFPEGASIGIDDTQSQEFNTIQQQIGNLSIEIQGGEPPAASQGETIPAAPQRIEAFESIDLAVRYTTIDGEALLDPNRSDLPPSFFTSTSKVTRTPDETSQIERAGNGQNWLIKSYPVMTNDALQGFLTLGQPLQALQAVLADLGWRIAGAGLAALSIAVILSIYSTRGLVTPISALMHASRSIPLGKFKEPLPLERRDELGELSRTFEEMRGKLEAIEKLRSQFISDVSHELRTPLTAIKGLTETLQDGAVDDPLVRDRFLASIERETDRLIRMTHDLLTLTRIDAQSLVLRWEELDLKEILESALRTLHSGIEEKKIRVKLELPEGRILLEADKDRLIQILYNLLDNAIQHSPVGGEIAISYQQGYIHDPALRSELLHPFPYSGSRPTQGSIDGDQAWGLLKIQDHGPGIALEELQHIFERFYRAETSRLRSVGGAGLGLSIARALSEAHGAHLWIHSPPPGDSRQGALAMLMVPVLKPGR